MLLLSSETTCKKQNVELSARWISQRDAYGRFITLSDAIVCCFKSPKAVAANRLFFPLQFKKQHFYDKFNAEKTYLTSNKQVRLSGHFFNIQAV